jgi:2-methylcitrate dehydratase PrpD
MTWRPRPGTPRWRSGRYWIPWLPSTTHISAVCGPAALATGGGARGYLAAAGVMARLGTALGWPHYSAGWHATCTAGAPAAAAGAAVALGLDPGRIAAAMALAIPGAGGVQRAFGTDAKSLQVGFAVETGLRAARLAAAGAQADPAAVDDWLRLVGGDPAAVDPGGPAVPGGLAVKIYPCCYALQRPISALAPLAAGLDPAQVRGIVLRTPAAAVVPLIHHRPQTGLAGKFSLEYAAAVALLDGHPGFASFTDQAVRRPAAQRLVRLAEVELTPGGAGLLDGEFEAEVRTADGTHRVRQRHPPGSPGCPPSPGQLQAKLADCLAGVAGDAAGWPPDAGLGAGPDSAAAPPWTWDSAAAVLRRCLPATGEPPCPS